MSGTARRLLAVVVALVPLLGGTARAQDAGIFTAQLPVTAPAGLDLSGPLVVTLELLPQSRAKVASLTDWFPGAHAGEDSKVVLLLAGDAAQHRPPEARDRAPSLIVDFDAPAVEALRAEVVQRYGASPDGEQLAAFVDAFITHKGLGRLLDGASQVATRREGDCTEHATLLVALARMFGRPARIVYGLVLARGPGRVAALGHAWAEIHDGTAWRRADGALRETRGIRYLPLAAVVDEGPGYGFAALQLLSPIDLRGIAVASGRAALDAKEKDAR